MKNKLILLFALFSIVFVYSQEKNNTTFHQKPRYFVSVCGTLVKNPYWTLSNSALFYDEGGEYFFNFGGFLIRNGFEVAYTEDILFGIGFGVDFQFNEPYGKLFTAPVYFQTRTYLPFKRESPFFLQAGIGKLLNLGGAFEKGTYYNFGLGYDFIDEFEKYGISLILEFHHKRIPNIISGEVNSVSIGVGFRFL